MRFTVLLTALAASTMAAASPVVSRGIDWGSVFGFDLTKENHYGAPKRPWEANSRPGWYFGKHPDRHPKLTCLAGPICKFLKFFPRALQCPVKPPTNPPPSDGYTSTFSNHTGATQAGDYMTYGLVETVADCKAMCNSVEGCGFANTYRDVNGKDGSPLLTCSLYRDCHTVADATNTGGQTQPDGSVNYITNSDGWCKQ